MPDNGRKPSLVKFKRSPISFLSGKSGEPPIYCNTQYCSLSCGYEGRPASRRNIGSPEAGENSLTPLSLRFDVRRAFPDEILAGERLELAGWVFPPASAQRTQRPVVVALFSGATYDKRYHHAQVPGRIGYSMAEDLACRGHLVVLIDHLGVGESSRTPIQMRVTRQVAAQAAHAAVEQVFASLRTGDLAPGLPPWPDFRSVGGGHSMGAMQVISQQAEHRSFDCVAIMGYTAAGASATIRGVVRSADPGDLDFGEADYRMIDRNSRRWLFHAPDVPDDVIAADEALNVEVPHVLHMQARQTGIVRDDAARIGVPVFICLAENDISPDPQAEPALYPHSPEVVLQILPNSGHCHCFASTRKLMWDAIDAWIIDTDARAS